MENKFKIIEAKDYILAVYDDEIKEGDLCFLEENYYVNGGVGKYNHQKASGWGIAYSPHGHNFFKKIIAHQPKGNTPELDLPLLPEIVVEGDIEKLAWETKCISRKEVYELFNKELFKDKRIDGYYSISASTQVHQFNERLRELAKNNVKEAAKVYIEEDLRKAIDKGYELARMNLYKADNTLQPKIEEYIQSIKQPKTTLKWFVAEMEYIHDDSVPYPETKGEKLKTTTINNKTYLVGHYE